MNPNKEVRTEPILKDKTNCAQKEDTAGSQAGIIYDPTTKKRYAKGNFLGKGGFAKCYEVVDSETNAIYACKIVSKSQLVKQHQKDKMASEIAIHKSLDHPNVVKFHRFFEDNDNVHILLEICRKRTLLELHKRRKALTDPEVRFYVHQIAVSCKYMHENNVIHRDLKLGNLFLDDDLRVKVGDFGLAAKIEFTGERKKTLCGTPNYIAPEILNKRGHSFEVDIWSFGCIIYTLYVGTPPFETSNVKETYNRIKRNYYTIPSKVPKSAQLLIVKLLQSDPTKRPNISEVLADAYFTSGYLPTTLPLSSLTVAPRFPSALQTSQSIGASTKQVLNGQFVENTTGAAAVAKIATIPDQGNTRVDPYIKATERSHAVRVVDGDMTSFDDEPVPEDDAEPKDCYLKELWNQVTNCLLKKPHKRAVIQEEEAEDPASTPFYWIGKWVDYSEKYGIGYQLNDGSFGVLFNDCTRLISTEDKAMVTYIGADGVESYMTMESYDSGLKKKVTLLLYFHEYMHKNLLTAGQDIVPSNCNDMTRLPTLRMWSRNSQCIIFHLSCGIFQVNFFEDHCKLILCPRMASVTFINESRQARTFRFALLEKYGCSPAFAKKLRLVRNSIKLLIDSSKGKNPPAS